MIMNILILRLSALGDVAMTIPAIYSVACTYPQHRFMVATTAFASRLFIEPPSNVEVLALSKEESKGIAGTWRLLKRLRTLHVDAVADLHNVLRSWVIDVFFRLSGKSVVMLDKHRRERRAILHEHGRMSRSFVECYFDVFAHLGLSALPQFTSLFSKHLPPLPSGFQFKDGERCVGIAPFARFRTKIYDLAKMQEVVRLLADSGVRVFLFGARGSEEKQLREWARGKENVDVVAGRLSIEEELALMAHLDVMLTMDSANMHLASLVGTRVVSLWGGTTPACGFLGYGQHEEDALVAGLMCQPCSIAGGDSCRRGSFDCIQCISPSIIVEKLIC
ncbi:MAG: glycosyltransferase family 9 protein [Bacteroidaceae bacterium]|nr:glycosyltransferase family 9 protein [Bacteroidaceae bacterium]